MFRNYIGEVGAQCDPQNLGARKNPDGIGLTIFVLEFSLVSCYRRRPDPYGFIGLTSSNETL